MSDCIPELRDLLSPYLDEEVEDEVSLRRAADWTRVHARDIDMAELLDWVQRYPAAKARKTRVQILLRAALGLPLVPGAVCRPTPE